MELDEYYHDGVEFGDHDIDEYDDMSDIDQEELEVRLYSQIHYQTDPDKEKTENICVQEISHSDEHNVPLPGEKIISNTFDVDRSQDLMPSKERVVNESDNSSKLLDTKLTQNKNNKSKQIPVVTEESPNNVIGSSKRLEDEQPNRRKELKIKESVVVELGSESDHSTRSYTSLDDSDSEGFVALVDNSLVEDVQLHLDIPTKGRVNSKSGRIDKAVDIEHPDTTLDDVHNALPDNGWSIIPQDNQSRRVSSMNRYYKPLNVRCNNCHERGHLSKVCPQPKKIVPCCLCGEQSHRKKRCPNSHCHNCLAPGHSIRDCLEPRRKLWQQCHTCEMQGHRALECPNRWRQFHVTTDMNNLHRGSNDENSRVYCCNCGKQGHFHHDCLRELMDKYSRPTWPFITRYELRKECRIFEQNVKRLENLEKQEKEYEDEGNMTPKRNKKKFKANSSEYISSNNKSDDTSKFKNHIRIGKEINKHTFFNESDNKGNSSSGKRKRGQYDTSSNKNKRIKYDSEAINMEVNKNHSFIQSAIEANGDKKKKRRKKKKGKNTEHGIEQQNVQRDIANQSYKPQDGAFNAGLRKIKNMVDSKLSGTYYGPTYGPKTSRSMVIENRIDTGAKMMKKKKNKRKKKGVNKDFESNQSIQKNRNVHSQQPNANKGIEQQSNKGKKKRQRKKPETFPRNRGFIFSNKGHNYQNYY